MHTDSGEADAKNDVDCCLFLCNFKISLDLRGKKMIFGTQKDENPEGFTQKSTGNRETKSL